MLKKILVVFIAGFLFCSTSGFSFENEKSDFEEIVVTAQKQEQNIQDVPISMTVFKSSDLEDMQIHSIADMAAYTPGLMIFDNGTSGFTPPTMRGLHTNVEALSTTMGMYIDGVPVLSGVGFDEVLMDVERVEILKGPQGHSMERMPKPELLMLFQGFPTMKKELLCGQNLVKIINRSLSSVQAAL